MALFVCLRLCATSRGNVIDGSLDPDHLPIPDPEVVQDPEVEQSEPLVQAEDRGPTSVDEMQMLDGLYQ